MQVVAHEIRGAFRIITNGGDGLRGQDGGDGVNGLNNNDKVNSICVIIKLYCLKITCKTERIA